MCFYSNDFFVYLLLTQVHINIVGANTPLQLEWIIYHMDYNLNQMKRAIILPKTKTRNVISFRALGRRDKVSPGVQYIYRKRPCVSLKCR